MQVLRGAPHNVAILTLSKYERDIVKLLDMLPQALHNAAVHALHPSITTNHLSSIMLTSLKAT